MLLRKIGTDLRFSFQSPQIPILPTVRQASLHHSARNNDILINFLTLELRQIGLLSAIDAIEHKIASPNGVRDITRPTVKVITFGSRIHAPNFRTTFLGCAKESISKVS
eukprot:764554-Hanusia_phi.AAC.3